MDFFYFYFFFLKFEKKKKIVYVNQLNMNIQTGLI